MKALNFEGTGAEYFKIWIVNILLTIVTLGIYYPWAKVRTHRYFYANSTLENRNFEYHATGKQLFVGYLIAVALLIVYTGIQAISPILGLVALLILFLAIPWIIWRSLKFNLRMTSFSNVRFGFDGQLGGAYVNYLLLPIACFIAFYAPFIILGLIVTSQQASFGVAMGFITFIVTILLMGLSVFLFSFMKKKHTHYAINGYGYGQGQFLTDVEVKPFFKILLKSIGISVLLFTAIMIIIAIFASLTVGIDEIIGMGANLENPETMQESMSQLFMITVPVYLGFIIVSLISFAYIYTRQRTYILANCVLDEKITFASTLKAIPFAWIMISNLLMTIFTLGLALPWAKVRMARTVLENTQVDVSVGFDAYLTQQQSEQSSLGDQIGDAFDVDVGIGF